MRCYVLIDLKRDKLTHQDLGQMQMYIVNAEWGTHCPPHMIRVDGNPLLLLVHSIHPDLLQTLQGGE